MTEIENNPISKREITIARILSLLVVVMFIYSFYLFFLVVSDGNVQPNVLLSTYVFSTGLLIATYRNTVGFKGIAAIGSKNRGALILYLFPLFFLATSSISKMVFNQMGFINSMIVVFVVIHCILFSFLIFYKNPNFASGSDNIFYKILVPVLGLFIGYGFSLLLNFMENPGLSGSYTLVIEKKYIQDTKGKGGIAHSPHFIVGTWEYSSTFGNDIEVPEKWVHKYDNIHQISNGDAISLKIHHGLLKLDWIEVEKFVQLK